jgi:hypothetical protein
MKTIILLLLSCIIIASCTQTQKGFNKKEIDQIYNSLKDKEAKAIIRIDGKAFYPNKSIFNADLRITDHFFKINLFDQFESNIVVNMGGENWYSTKPYSVKLIPNTPIEGGLMIGKLVDKINRNGEGYLMTEGEITMESLSKEKCIISVKGKIGKYNALTAPQTWNNIEGIIICKKPSINIQNLTESQVFF